MMITANIETLLEHVKAAAVTRSYIRTAHIERARTVHKSMSKQELIELADKALDLNTFEMRMLWAIGLRAPTRGLLAEKIVERSLDSN